MEILNLIRCEFIKHFSWKKNIIIILALIICSILIIKSEGFFGTTRMYSQSLSLEKFNSGYQESQQKFNENPNLINKGIFEGIKELETYYKKAYELINNDEKDSWQKQAINSLELGLARQMALELLSSNYQNIEIKEIINDYSENPYAMDLYSNYKSNYIQTLKQFYDSSLKKIDDEKDFLYLQNNLIIKSLEQNEYYLYVKSNCLKDDERIKKVNIDIYNAGIKYCEYFNNHEIKSDSDYRSINAKQFLGFANSKDWYKMPNEEEFNKSHDGNLLSTYKDTKKFYSLMNRYVADEKLIVSYAFENELKHDVIMLNNVVEEKYNSSKSLMNLGLHFGVIIMIIIAITNSGIVSKEHDKGTIKLLLTKPVSRNKVLFSKYLYLILDTYIWWTIASIILFMLAGIKCGFNDLFTSKLIVTNGIVKEINYLLWYFKEMIICSIPVLCMLCVLFSLSTITLSTSLTASITSILSIISVTIWALISNFNATFLTFLSYTPIPYLDYWFTRYHSRYYIQTISTTPLNDEYGLLISIVVTIVLFLLTILIYNKRDIKN